MLAPLYGVAGDYPGYQNVIGLRFGLGLDPDQMLAGVNSNLLKITRNLYFSPSVDIGIDDDYTIYTFNADLGLPLFSAGEDGTVFYGSAGPVLSVFSADGNTESEFGFSANAGLSGFHLGSSGPYNAEFRVGFGDIHEFKLLFGIWL
jgi:hypothetical protein